jgi:hypothetical protein
MATFLNGVTDYVTQTNPTQSNLAFDQQALQTKEAAYLAGHKKVNDLYGSLLNSNMSRGENIAARDEFFKMVNQDIKRMGGLDFSLDTNVAAASNVFQSIYSNKNIVKDMVWTKNNNNQKERSEALKNCIDPTKCGGQWWEKGDKYLSYKEEEFKNASTTEALGMSDTKYVPYTDVMAKAMKIAKDADLSISKDYILGSGYKVTNKNGQEVLSPLTALLSETLGNDPNIAEMFKVDSYVERKDWVYNELNTGQFENEEDAHVGYFKMRSDAVARQLREANDGVNLDVDMLKESIEELQEKNPQPGTVSHNDLQYKQLMLQKASLAQQHLQRYNLAQENIHNQVAMRTLGESLDENDSANKLNVTINQAAEILSHKGEESKMELDKKAEMAIAHQYRVSEEATEFNHSKLLVAEKAKYGAYDGTAKKDKEKEKNEVTSTEITSAKSAKLAHEELISDAGIKKELGGSPTPEKIAQYKKDNAEKFKASAMKANIALIKAGEMPIDYTQVNAAMWQKDMDNKQKGTYIAKLIKDKKNDGLTNEQLWKFLSDQEDGTYNVYE